MSGFAHDGSGIELVFSKNVDFSGGTVPTGQILTNGQMLIGTTIVNAGGTHINVGTITSPDSSITFSYTSPNITAIVSGGSTVGKTITGDSGGALSPTSGNWNIFGTANQITTTGLGSTLTLSIPAVFIAPGSVESTGILKTDSGQIIKTTVPGAYPYTTLTSDYVILVDTASARTINLVGSPVTGVTYRIKDNVGSAAANNITITPAAGTIDGAASFTINANWGSVDCVYNGTSWRIL